MKRSKRGRPYLILGLTAVVVDNGDEEDFESDVFDEVVFLFDDGLKEAFTDRSGVFHVAED